MKRQALVIGINRYPFLKQHLDGPDRDANDIANLLDRPQEHPDDFTWCVERLLSAKIETEDSTVKTEELREAIQNLFLPTTKTPPEVVLLFFAGHGLRNKAGEVYLAASDVCPTRKDKWGFPIEELRELMQKSKIPQQIVFLDCCHSGDLVNGLTNLTEPELQQWNIGGSRLIVTACRDDRTAKGIGKRGVLTEALLQGLDPQNRETGYWVSTYFLYEFLMRHINYNPLLKEQIPLCYRYGEPINFWMGKGESDRLPTSTIGWWKSICEQRLEQQHAISSKFLTGIAPKIEDVYVPLGLVERQQKSRQKDGGEIDATRGSALYEETEITRRFQHHEFLENVLRRGDSPKSKGKRLVILGEPGAGKTTLLQQASRWVAAEIEDAIVLWVSLADLGGRSLEDYLLEVWLLEIVRMALEVSVSETDKKDFIVQVDQGRVWLFLDGADEMAASKPLLKIDKQIRNPGWLNKARILLTCRLNLWDSGSNPLAEFDVYRTLEFDYPVQVEQFINSWFTDLGKTDEKAIARGQQLCTALKESGKERIQDLVKNPLRLTLLCFTWHKWQGKLPDTKAGLYENFIERFYEWIENKFPVTVEKQEQLNKALGELAREAIDKELTRFRLRRKFVSKFLGSPKDKKSLFYLALQVGWLNQVGVDADNPDEPVYAFYHASFQEYFAALAVEDWQYFLHHIPQNPQLGTYRIFEKQWKQVILLWLGRENIPKDQKEEFINGLVEFHDGCRGFYKYQAYFLAAAGIAEFKTCNRSQEIVAEIVKWGFGYFDNEKQSWMTFYEPIPETARKALKETDSQKAIILITQLINTDCSESIRWQAAESLGEIDPGNPQAIAVFIDLIAHSHDEFTRWKAAEELGKIDPGNPQAIAVFIDSIAHSRVYPPSAAAKRLGKIDPGNPQAIAALIDLIAHSHSHDEYTRTSAANSLGYIAPGNPQAIAALIDLITHSHDEYTRRSAADSLGKIDPGNPQAITALIDLITHSQDESIRIEAADSLGKIDPGNPQTIAALIDLITHSHDEDTRNQAAYNLGKIWYIAPGHSQAIAALIDLIAHSHDEDISRQAAESLGYIDPGNPQAITTLTDLIARSQDESIRIEAADSLGYIDPWNPQVIAALIDLITHSQDENIRRRAAYNLGKIGKIAPGHSQTIAILIDLIAYSQHHHTRYRAAESLEKILLDDFISEGVTLLGVRQNQEGFKVLWQCAQKMSYPAFYEAYTVSTLEYCQKWLEIKRTIGDKRGEADYLIAIGTLYQQSRKFREGQAFLQQAIYILQEINAPIDAYPFAQWLKSIIKFANGGKLQLALCFIAGLIAFPIAFPLALMWFLAVWLWRKWH